MAFGLELLADQRKQDLDAAIEEAQGASTAQSALQILLQAIDGVRDTISSSVVDKVTVRNQDEIKAALHNELNRISKPIIAAISKLALDKKKIAEIEERVKADNAVALETNFDIQVVRRPKERIHIDNIGDIAFPESVNVSNLSDVQAYFDNLAEVMRETFKIDIPAPQVTVTPPEVNIPENVVNIPPLELDPIIEAMKPLKFLSDRPNKPISVRLSDGQKFLRHVSTIVENQQKQMAAFSQGLTEASLKKQLKAQNKFGAGGSGGLALTSATTAVQLSTSNTPCSMIQLCCTGGPIAYGWSATTVDVSLSDTNSNGAILYPGNSPVNIPIDNLNKLYVAGASGTKACYVYYS